MNIVDKILLTNILYYYIIMLAGFGIGIKHKFWYKYDTKPNKIILHVKMNWKYYAYFNCIIIFFVSNVAIVISHGLELIYVIICLTINIIGVVFTDMFEDIHYHNEKLYIKKNSVPAFILITLILILGFI